MATSTAVFSPKLSFSSVGRNIVIGTTIGISIGIGITAGIFIIKKIKRQLGNEDEVVVCMLELTRELRELRSTMVRLEGSLAESRTAKIKPVSSSVSLKEVVSLRLSSDDEDEFYEMPQDEEIITISRTEQLERSSVPLEASKALIKTAEELYDDKNVTFDNTEQIQTILEEAVQKFPEEAELWWRLARCYYDLSSIRGKNEGEEVKKDLLYKGLAVAQKAVEVNENLSAAHKWCAIMLGSTNPYESSTQDQIALGYKSKEYMMKAIELNDRDPSVYHCLGRWCFEVSQLPWWKRKAAAAIASEPPTSTVQEALENFLKAEDLKPGFWLANSYWIAKCYYQQSEYSKSKEWLQKTLEMKQTSEEDREWYRKAAELLGYV